MSVPPGKHHDWLWPFSLIPRSATAKESLVPPYVVVASQGLDPLAPLDVPKPGTWALMRSHVAFGFDFALTTTGHWHFRIGTFRYDYIDHYYQFPTFTVKKIGT